VDRGQSIKEKVQKPALRTQHKAADPLLQRQETALLGQLLSEMGIVSCRSRRHRIKGRILDAPDRQEATGSSILPKGFDETIFVFLKVSSRPSALSFTSKTRN